MAAKVMKILVGIVLVSLAAATIMSLLFSVFINYQYPQLLPSQFTWQYWQMLFTSRLFLASLQTSIVVGLLTGLVATSIGFTFAYALFKNNLLDSAKIRIFYTLPLLLPPIFLIIGMHKLSLQFGISSTFFSVVLAHVLLSVPYTINIAKSFFAGLTPEVILVSKTLGATSYHRLKYVYAPLSVSYCAFSFSIGFLLSFSEYFASLLLGGGTVTTLATVYYPYILNGERGNAAVVSLVFVFINLSVLGLTSIVAKKLNRVEAVAYE